MKKIKLTKKIIASALAGTLAFGMGGLAFALISQGDLKAYADQTIEYDKSRKFFGIPGVITSDSYYAEIKVNQGERITFKDPGGVNSSMKGVVVGNDIIVKAPFIANPKEPEAPLINPEEGTWGPAPADGKLVLRNNNGLDSGIIEINGIQYYCFDFIPNKPTPQSSNFTFTPPSELTAGRDRRNATVSVKSSISGMGNKSGTYYKKEGTDKYDSEVPRDVGTYQVAIKLDEGSAFGPISQLTDPTWTFTLTKATPQASDFTFTAPTDTTAGSQREASFIGNNVYRMGDRTVYYSTDGSSWTEEAPSEVGTYYVAIDVAEGENFKAATKLRADNWKFTLTPPTRNISLNPSDTYTFPEEYTGYSPVTAKEITITNSGSDATGELTIALSGNNKDDFTLSTSSTPSIAVAGRTQFSIKPNDNLSAGTYTATVTVSGTGMIAQSLNVSFTVKQSSLANISLSETGTVIFPGQSKDYQPVAEKTITITNSGTEATPRLTITRGGTYATSFTLSKTGTSAIAANGGTDTFTIKPNDNLATGTYTAIIYVRGTNVATRSFNVSFTVTATPTASITLSETGTVIFTSQNAGYSPITAKEIAITNGGTAATGVLDIELSGTNKDKFTLSQSSVTPIDAGGNATFTIEPKNDLEAGTYTARVTVKGTDVTSQSFDVSFTVTTAPAFSIALSQTETFTFTDQNVGYTSVAEETITITNSGTGPTGTLSIALSGTDAGSFTLSKTSTSAIAANGGTATFTIKPNDGLAAGTYTAKVTVKGTDVTEQSFDVSFTVKSSSSGNTDPGNSSGNGNTSGGNTSDGNTNPNNPGGGGGNTNPNNPNNPNTPSTSPRPQAGAGPSAINSFGLNKVSIDGILNSLSKSKFDEFSQRMFNRTFDYVSELSFFQKMLLILFL